MRIFVAVMSMHWIDHRRFRQLLTIFLVSATLLCMFPPQNSFAHWWSEQTLALAFVFLALGMVLHILNRQRLMFVFLGCSSALAFWMHEMRDKPDTNANMLKVDLIWVGPDSALVADAQHLAASRSGALCVFWTDSVTSTRFMDSVGAYVFKPLAGSGLVIAYPKTALYHISSATPEGAYVDIWAGLRVVAVRELGNPGNWDNLLSDSVVMALGNVRAQNLDPEPARMSYLNVNAIGASDVHLFQVHEFPLALLETDTLYSKNGLRFGMELTFKASVENESEKTRR